MSQKLPATKAGKRRLIHTCEKNPASGASEVVALMLLTDLGNIVQSQVQDDNLDETRKSCGYNLRQKHCTRWNLHVVAEFEVGHKTECLRPVNVN